MTTNAITKVQDEQRLIKVLGASLYPGAKPESIALVLEYCKARKLDPMQKPVHIVPMNGKDVLMMSIDFLRTQASRSGQLAGIGEPEFGYNGKQLDWCRVTVKRFVNGQICEFSAREFYEECVGTGPVWKKRPRGMLAKCAESQALRRAFPEFAGSETAEEMEGKSYFEETKDDPVETPEMLALADKAYEVAQQGFDAYKVFWKQISADDRKYIQSKYPQGLASIAKEADAKRAAEDVVDVDPVSNDNGITQNPDGTYSWQ